MNLSLAPTRRWKDRDSGEKHEQTDWHRIVAFGRTAEVVGEFVWKGSQLYVEGALRTRAWLDKEEKKRHTTEVIARSVQLLGRPEDRRVPGPAEVAEGPAVEEDISF